MASRKEQKEQARAARIAQQEAAAANAQRTRRIQIFGGAIAIAVIVIVVAIVVSSGGSGGGLKHGKQASAAYKQVNAELAGIPQSGTTLGKPSAKVTMLYFGDLQCPVCADFTTGNGGGGLPQFIQNYVRTGKVKLEYRSFCTATCNNFSNGQSLFNTQQTAAYAAGKQNLFWDYAELFYRQQGTEGSGYMTPTFLNKLAEQIPKLNLSKWQQARKDPSLLSQVTAENTTLAAKYKASGTPEVVMIGPKGPAVLGSQLFNYSQLQAGVQAVS